MKALAALVMLCAPLAYTTRVHAWLSARLASRRATEPALPGWCEECGRSYIDHATHERIAHIAAPSGPDDWT